MSTTPTFFKTRLVRNAAGTIISSTVVRRQVTVGVVAPDALLAQMSSIGLQITPLTNADPTLYSFRLAVNDSNPRNLLFGGIRVVPVLEGGTGLTPDANAWLPTSVTPSFELSGASTRDYTVTRPAAASPPGGLVFTATGPNRNSASIAIEIPSSTVEQSDINAAAATVITLIPTMEDIEDIATPIAESEAADVQALIPSNAAIEALATAIIGNYRCKIHKSIQAITGGNDSIDFTSTIFDIGDLHDPGSNPNRVTIPSTNFAGVWLFIAQVSFITPGTTPSGIFAVNIVDKDGLTIGTDIQPYISASQNQVLKVVGVVVDPAAGDWFQVKVGQTATSSVDVSSYFTAVHLW